MGRVGGRSATASSPVTDGVGLRKENLWDGGTDLGESDIDERGGDGGAGRDIGHGVRETGESGDWRVDTGGE